ncbi:hypothetical protein F2Q70_00000534 [Brassica cretica]|uniref:C3H1-type domain-containing protein n=1 Tax=Brassica cretica TaxID=69181 RepID=A0A8S9INT8_BRACR|nr:hypothetical protein F2Q70_00000534 [Brassica cretica]
MKLDVRQATVWNTLGLMLLKAGCLMSAISVLSSLLALVPDNYDCLTNLGVAYLQSGDLELSAKCFQDLVLKDHNHPAALINYAAELLCKHSSTVAGAGANGGPEASEEQKAHLNVAKECLLAAVRADPKSAHAWVNLANSYYMMGDHRSSSKCLEKAAKLDPNCMATRFAVAVQRIKDAERSQDAGDQLSWAGNEMASVIREGESVPIDPPIAWAGLAMAHKAHHEIAAAFVADRNELTEMEERAMDSLKQAVSEDPEDAVRWHQLGLHCLCSQQYKLSQNSGSVCGRRGGGRRLRLEGLGVSCKGRENWGSRCSEHGLPEDEILRKREDEDSKDQSSMFPNRILRTSLRVITLLRSSLVYLGDGTDILSEGIDIRLRSPTEFTFVNGGRVVVGFAVLGGDQSAHADYRFIYGICKFGPACRFDHSIPPAFSSSSSLTVEASQVGGNGNENDNWN